MSEESLSALLDGECTKAELHGILADGELTPAAMRRWGRMCQVREVLSGGHLTPSSEAFCAAVMTAVQNDHPGQGQSVRHARVVPLRVRARRWQPLLGLAAAASIAAVAMVGTRQWIDRAPGSGAVTAKAQPPAAVTVVSARTPATMPAAAPADPDELRWSQLDADTSGQLNEFVLEHSNLRAGQGMGGSLSYARMINVRATESHSGGEPH